MKKICPKCQTETENLVWEYCRPCKDNSEFVHLELKPDDQKNIAKCWECGAALKTELELQKNECSYCYVQRKL